MYAIRFQLQRNGNRSARKGNGNGIGGTWLGAHGDRPNDSNQSSIKRKQTPLSMKRLSHMMRKSEQTTFPSNLTPPTILQLHHPTMSLRNCWDQPSALAGIDCRLLLESTVGSCWNRPSAFAGIDRRLLLGSTVGFC
jgi:hypothetical protein